jgi:hypothetical protein
MHHYRIKLNGQSKWNDIANSLMTANAKMDEVGRTSDGVGGGLAPATCVPRSRGKKWENGKEKSNAAVPKMMEKWEDIMAKEEEASVKRNELKEKNMERFRAFMEMQQKKVNLEEKKRAIKQICKESKILYMKADDLDSDVASSMFTKCVAASLHAIRRKVDNDSFGSDACLMDVEYETC